MSIVIQQSFLNKHMNERMTEWGSIHQHTC